ncbi:hypothetical protein EBZ80_05420 [bacterium]|nr:hypothetical protein [bacterium]
MWIVHGLIGIKIVLIVLTIPWIVFTLLSVWRKERWIVLTASVLSQILFWGVLAFLAALTVLLLVGYHRETWVAFTGMFSAAAAATEERLFPRYLISLFLWLLLYFMVVIAVLLVSIYTERPDLVRHVL